MMWRCRSSGRIDGGGPGNDVEVAVRDEDEVAYDHGGRVEHVAQGAVARHDAVKFVLPDEQLREVRLEPEDEVREPVLLTHHHEPVGESGDGAAEGGGRPFFVRQHQGEGSGLFLQERLGLVLAAHEQKVGVGDAGRCGA